MEHAGEQGHHHGEKKENGGDNVAQGGSSRAAVILLGALAVHSILEMMALGLADTFGDCALLTLSIALHQVNISLVCFALLSCKFILALCAPVLTCFN